jgi:hypothetical protein
MEWMDIVKISLGLALQAGAFGALVCLLRNLYLALTE